MPRKTKSHESAALRAARDLNREQMIKEIRAMTYKANARLRSLEKAGLTRASAAYRYIERRNFDKDTAVDTTKSGALKFSQKLAKKSMQQLVHEKRELERFLYEAKTSTVKGTEQGYIKAFDKYVQNHPGLGITREEFGEMASIQGFSAFVKHYGSTQIETLLSLAKDNEVSPDEVEDILAKSAPDEPLSNIYKEIQNAGRFAQVPDYGEGWESSDPWENI